MQFGKTKLSRAVIFVGSLSIAFLFYIYACVKLSTNRLSVWNFGAALEIRIENDLSAGRWYRMDSLKDFKTYKSWGFRFGTWKFDLSKH